MYSRAALAALSLICLPALATAQVDSESMDDLNAWGEGFLSAQEQDFPITLWTGSDDQTLLSLMQQTGTRDLTLAERRLLRRVILSPTRKPSGPLAEDLLAERARLMLDLGEADAAARLAPRLQGDDHGLDAETIAVDLDLARGREASACTRLDGEVPQTEYWYKLRAVCAVLQENYAGAELAVEFASSQGMDDPWFVEAIFAASGDSIDPPVARFDSGMNIALSAKANLDTHGVELESSRPDLAAAAAARPGVPDVLRARLASLASQVDLVSPADHRDILTAQLDEDGFTPTTAVEEALFVLEDPLAAPDEKLAQLASVLDNLAYGPMAAYASTADLFQTDLQRLLKGEGAPAYGVTFARAALAAGRSDLMQAWLTKAGSDAYYPPDPFQVAMLEALDLISGGEQSLASVAEVQTRLLESISNDAEAALAARVLALWTGFDIVLDADARYFMSVQAESGRSIEPYTLLAIRSAAQSGAFGEAALMMLKETEGHPQQLTSSDMATLIAILRDMGAEDIARQFALETSEFWMLTTPPSELMQVEPVRLTEDLLSEQDISLDPGDLPVDALGEPLELITD